VTCAAYAVLRYPTYRDDLDAIEAWIAKDDVAAAAGMWLLIDEQVDQLADGNFPRRKSEQVQGAYELVAHENYLVYFDQDDVNCSVAVRSVVHVARQFPP
jgi:toxin ParE1/3/4